MIAEPLAESAPLARRLALAHCRPTDAGGCAWYHGAWQYLRLLGLITSLDADGPFFADAFRRLPARARVLISATADYGLLAHVLAAQPEADITVLDLCPTPLLLNRWYAERAGRTVQTVAADVLDYRPVAPFDLVCSHSFLGRFSAGERPRLIAAWRRLVRPGGRIVTVKRVRSRDLRETTHATADDARTFAARVRRAATERPPPDLSPDELEGMAAAYAARKGDYVIRSAAELRALFADGGLIVEHFAAATSGAASSTPDKAASERYQIVARRPG